MVLMHGVCVHVVSSWGFEVAKIPNFNLNLFRAPDYLESGRVVQNRVINGFSFACCKARKVSILNEKGKKQKLGQGMSYSLDI